jgi:hypothetical protein
MYEVILLIGAIVCFACASFKVRSTIEFVPVGLLPWALSIAIPRIPQLAAVLK